MIIFAKYSNERAKEFRIRTEIRKEPDGRICVRKTPACSEAVKHVESIHQKYRWLKNELAQTDISVNECTLYENGAEFPFLNGVTLEEELDELAGKGKTEELLKKIDTFFGQFSNGSDPFVMTPEFEQIFGRTDLPAELVCQPVTDIDMIFSNAIRREDRGYELIDYEWTFDFPIPVKFVQYRCLYYYLYGNAARESLTQMGIFEQFGINEELKKQFEKMEAGFQAYMLGNYTPNWKLYDDISEGVLDIRSYAEKESRKNNRCAIDVFFDDGRGYGIWNCLNQKVHTQGRVSYEFMVPENTKMVRLDPCSFSCILRIYELTQEGKRLTYTSNGEAAHNGDLFFDTEDPQLYFHAEPGKKVHIEFLAEETAGLAREMIMSQTGRIRWMEGTKAWKLYQLVKGES